MAHLFLISLGPIQEFIASARRSRDLWYGSWLLSELAKTAARTVSSYPNHLTRPLHHNLDRLIFPAPAREAELETADRLSVANKILALVPDPPQDGLAEAVEKALHTRLADLWQEVYTRLKTPPLETAPLAAAQIDDLLDYLWVALPLPNPTQYKTVRQELEALLAARKLTRDFRPVHLRANGGWGSAQPKSSLDGQRESVIPDPAYPTGPRDPQRALKIQDLFRHYGAGAAERLSGVDLLKRHGQAPLAGQATESRFPSTSHMAALPLLTHMQQLAAQPAYLTKARQAWNDYVAKVKGLGVDPDRLPDQFPPHPILGNVEGGLLFESRLIEWLEGDNLDTARKALRTFLNDQAKGHEPSPYYALLHADGDNMGKAIDAQETAAQHQALSQVLAAFARQVRGIVEGQHSGALVYAGGDDALAFLPLHTVLACARALAEAFDTQMAGLTNSQQIIAPSPQPTLSVGIAITHHIEPLSDALDLARRAEQAAKHVKGKNAVAIIVRKRSGFDTGVQGTWGTLDQRLDRFITLHRQQKIPHGYAYELRDLTIRLLDRAQGRAEYAALSEAAGHEALRILERKQADDSTKAIISELLAGSLSIRALADELIVARLLAGTVGAGGNTGEDS